MLLINNNNEEKTMEKEEGIISNIKDESKNNDKVGIEQVKTQYGLYLYGQITMIEQILNREI